MKKFNEEELLKIEQCIINVEEQTDAELVCVFAQQSDDYRYIPLMWALLFALVSPALILLGGWWLDQKEVLLVQAIVFFVLFFVFKIPAIQFRLIPKTVRQWRASNMARRQFLENNLHHTASESGVLIFISQAEHYVEIIADRGISVKVPDKEWQDIVDRFVQDVKNKRVQEGLIQCIESCGEKLKNHFPKTEEKNQLPNRLVII